jgi:beta-xylosidase
VEFARNTITRRTVLPGCAAEVTADAEDIREGDVAGLCLLIGSYGLAGITREKDGYFLVMKARKPGEPEEQEYARIPWNEKTARFRAEVSFEGSGGIVRFFFLDGGTWKPIGPAHEMQFRLDHFTGCRFGLFLYATRETGGSAGFKAFRFNRPE